MRGRGISFMSAVSLFLFWGAFSIAYAGMREMVWKEANSGIRDTEMQKVAVSTESSDTVYAGSSKAVYRTDDGGKTWNEVLSFRGTGNMINTLTAASGGRTVFAGTNEGLFRSVDRALHWTNIFSGVNDLKGSVLSIAAHPLNSEVIFIGTGSGLYLTDDNGSTWNKLRGLSDETPVSALAVDTADPRIMYAASGSTLYKSTNSGLDWQRVLMTTAVAERVAAPDENGITETDVHVTEDGIRVIVIDMTDNRMIYAGTSSRLFTSGDGGASWKPAGGSGLIEHDIKDITLCSGDKDSILAATGNGVFSYSLSTDTWHEMYSGLVSSDVRAIACSPSLKDSPAILWAASKKGIFTTAEFAQAEPDSEDTGAQQLFSEFEHEPTIEEIRNAAIEYAEVQPEKIDRWRKAAAKKALLPHLTLSYNKNKTWQKSTYFYSTKDEKYKDDDVTHDKDKEWSISLSWDLSELIWNNDQTSIDSRSKLMVELRDDVLNEVTRLFFERRRMQIDLLISPPADRKGMIEKELRLQELTADIDAVTGSYLSKRLALLKK